MMDADYAALKPLFVLAYGLFGIVCLALAWRPVRARLSARCHGMPGRSIAAGLAAVAAVMLLARDVVSGSVLLLAAGTLAGLVFALQPGARTARRMIAGLAAIVLGLSLAWWCVAPEPPSPLPLAVFTLVVAGMVWGLSEQPPGTHSIVLPATAFLAGGVLLMIDFSAYQPGSRALFRLVHHWGAFTGPAMQIKAGLVPFYDIPLQYGLGPTLVLAAACGTNGCWYGAQAVFAGMTLASGLLFLLMGLTTRTPRGWRWASAATLVIFAAVFLWPGAPADGNVLMATPSVGGIRFFPVTLVACLLFFGRPGVAAVVMVPAVLWSPESAAMSVAVFGLFGTARFGFLKAASLTAALLLGSYGVFVLAHRLIYGVFIDPVALVEYILHVPGPLPIDPFSSFVLLAAVLGLGGWLIACAADDPREQSRDLVVTALLFAATSYSLGRSHPNNICDLAPFLVLVALRALDRGAAQHDAMRRAVTAGLAVSVAALALSPWQMRPYGAPPQFDIGPVVAAAGPAEPDMDAIRSRIPNAAGLGIADFGPLLARYPTETIVWTPLDPSSLWSFVPSQRRQLYTQRSAMRLRRSGWAIVLDSQSFLFDDLLSGYRASNITSVDGGPEFPGGPMRHYRVACFDPKPQFAAVIVAAPCPANPS